MPAILLLFFLYIHHYGVNDNKITPTDKFTISGDIKSPITVTMDDIQKYKIIQLNQVVLTNHRGFPKDTIKNVKGVLLKEFLDKVELNVEKPKELGEFYLTFVCSDSFKAVFSWDEILNGETGKNLYIITEKNGQSIRDMDARIMVLVLSDSKIGRRHMNCLEKIIIRRTT